MYRECQGKKSDNIENSTEKVDFDGEKSNL